MPQKKRRRPQNVNSPAVEAEGQPPRKKSRGKEETMVVEQARKADQDKPIKVRTKRQRTFQNRRERHLIMRRPESQGALNNPNKKKKIKANTADKSEVGVTEPGRGVRKEKVAPFTDAKLAAAMRDELVESGVMTEEQRGLLLNNKTAENYVRETLSEGQLNKFAEYWKALGVWMTSKGGDLKNTTGANVPGRDGGNPVGLGIVPIYNDAFRDVNKHINSEDFSPVKAVSNHLRFVSVLGGDGDDSKSQ